MTDRNELSSVADLEKRLAAYCRRAGMEDDDPLRLALVTVTRAASDARAVVEDGAIAERAALVLAERAEALVERRTVCLGWRLSLAAAGVLVGGMVAAGLAGAWYGHRIAGAGVQELSAEVRELARGFGDFVLRDPEAAAVWLNLLRANDLGAAIRSVTCRKTSVVDGGWRGCHVPLWTEPVRPPR